MVLDDQGLRGSAVEKTVEWKAKKAFLEDPRCKLAKKCVIWCEKYEEKIKILLVRRDGRETIPLIMSFKRFTGKSVGEFTRDLGLISGTVGKASGLAA